MKTKIIYIMIFFLCMTKLYSVDIKDIIIDEYKISPQCTSLLTEDNSVKTLDVYKENNSIYVLGWSRNGKMAYIENRSIEGRGGHDFYFTIIDLVEDTITYTLKKRWYDDDDYGDSPENALTFQECIKKYSFEINRQLNYNKILLTPCLYQDFPIKDTNGNEITVYINILKKELGDFNLMYMSYEIYAKKNNQAKIINTINNKKCEYVKPTGFIKSPYEDRIAIIIANAEYVSGGDEVFINFYGCNLSTGFEE